MHQLKLLLYSTYVDAMNKMILVNLIQMIILKLNHLFMGMESERIRQDFALYG